MGLSGKYNFAGIKKEGAAGLKLLLASSLSTAWVLKFGSLTEFVLEWIINYLTNNGLVLLNIGANAVNGEIDQVLLDNAIDEGLKRIQLAGGVQNLTPEQAKEIDDAVIKAANKDLPYSSKPTKPTGM